jgi:hypothetical protein
MRLPAPTTPPNKRYHDCYQASATQNDHQHQPDGFDEPDCEVHGRGPNQQAETRSHQLVEP